MEVRTDKQQKMLKAVKTLHALVENDDFEKQRAAQKNFGGILSRSRELDYETVEIQDIPCEWSRLKRKPMKKYVILYCHGGGYTSGSYQYARNITNKLACVTFMDVLSFDYRLAPEHPYPAALEDATKIWDYLMHYGYGAGEVIVAGDSAGGNLALTLVMKLKEEGRLLPRAMVLFSPVTDMTMSGKSYEDKAKDDPILTKEYMTKCIECYAGGEDLKNPLLSPVYGDFTGFPPVCIQVGSNEILLSDSLKLNRQLQKYQVPVTMECFRGMWHTFQMSPLRNAYESIEHAAKFLFEIIRG